MASLKCTPKVLCLTFWGHFITAVRAFLHHNLSSSFVFYKATFFSFLLQFLFGLRVDEEMNLMFFTFYYF